MRHRLAAALRFLLAVPPRAQALTIGVAVGLVMLVGSATTTMELPWDGRQVPAVTAVSIACSSGDTVSVSWQIDDTKNPPPVSGVTLSGVPAYCASLPITVSITDGTGGVIASVTREPGAAASGTATWDFLPHNGGAGVPIPPIAGLRVDVPDPLGAPIPVVAGTDVTVAATYSDGTFLSLGFESIASGGGSVTVSSGDTAGASTGSFALSDPPVYFDVAVSGVSFSGAVEVCVFMPVSASFGTQEPRLFHFDAGAWVDATTSWDPATRRLCGEVDGFSPFALGLIGYDSKVEVAASAGSIALGGSVTTTASVHGEAPRVGGGRIDPTGGTTFSWCRLSASSGGTCLATGTIGAGTIVLTGGASASDGVAIATSAAFTPVDPGWYRLGAAYGGNGLYDPSETTTGTTALVQVGKATATILYSGDTYVVTGAAPALSATLTSSLDACFKGRTVRYVIDANGNGLADASEGTYASAPTNASGVSATTGTTLAAGIYELVTVADADASCETSSIQATLTVGGNSDSSNGGGWYTVSGVSTLAGGGRSNFGYNVSLKKTSTKGVTTTTISGRLLWLTQGKSKVTGTISTYTTFTCTGALSDGTTVCGALSGKGTLYGWDGVAWFVRATDVSFTAGIADGGSATTCSKGKNGKCTTTTRQDYFRLDVPAFAVDGETTAYQPLKGGNLIIR